MQSSAADLLEKRRKALQSPLERRRAELAAASAPVAAPPAAPQSTVTNDILRGSRAGVHDVAATTYDALSFVDRILAPIQHYADVGLEGLGKGMDAVLPGSSGMLPDLYSPQQTQQQLADLSSNLRSYDPGDSRAASVARATTGGLGYVALGAATGGAAVPTAIGALGTGEQMRQVAEQHGTSQPLAMAGGIATGTVVPMVAGRVLSGILGRMTPEAATAVQKALVPTAARSVAEIEAAVVAQALAAEAIGAVATGEELDYLRALKVAGGAALDNLPLALLAGGSAAIGQGVQNDQVAAKERGKATEVKLAEMDATATAENARLEKQIAKEHEQIVRGDDAPVDPALGQFKAVDEAVLRGDDAPVDPDLGQFRAPDEPLKLPAEPDMASSKSGAALNPFAGRSRVPPEQPTPLTEFTKAITDNLEPLTRLEAAAKAAKSVSGRKGTFGMMGKYRSAQSQIAYLSERAHATLVDPLVQKSVKAKIPLTGKDEPNAAEYLLARGARERNALIAERNPELQDGGSGMTNADADAIMQRYSELPNAKDYQEIGILFDKLTAERRRQDVKGGLETQDYADAIAAREPRYAPRKTDLTEEDVQSFLSGKRILGRESKAALGRESLPDDPVMFAIHDLQRSINRSVENKGRQAIYNVIKDRGLSNIGEIDPPHLKQFLRRTKEGPTVSEGIDQSFGTQENVIPVKIDGRQHFIELKPEFKDIALAANRLNSDNVHPALRFVGRGTRFLGKAWTQWRPDYFIKNVRRDSKDVAMYVTAERSKEFTADVFKNVPSALKELREGKADDVLRVGATVDYFDVSTLTDVKNSLVKRYEAAKDGPSKLSVIRDAVEHNNQIFERVFRVAVYRTARARGESIESARELSRNATNDWHIKGAWAPWMNSAYAFTSARIGTSRRFVKFLELAGKSKQARRVLGGAMALPFSVAMMNGMIAPKAEDGTSEWDKIPDWEKDNNLIVMLPDGTRFKMLLPSPLNLLASASWRMADSIRNGFDPAVGKSPGEAATGMLLATLDATDPLGRVTDDPEGTVMSHAPTLLQMPLEVGFNVKAGSGSKVAPERMPGDIRADSEMAWRDTSPAAKAIAKWINKKTGGDEGNDDGIDFSPAVLEHVGRFFTGGPLQITRDLMGGKLLDTFVKGPNPDQAEIDFRRNAKEAEKPLTRARMAAKGELEGQTPQEQGDLSLAGEAAKLQDAVNKLMKLADKGGPDAEKHRAKAMELMREFNKKVVARKRAG